MKNLIIILLVGLSFPGFALAQSVDRTVVGAAGEVSTSASIGLSWTVGEQAVATRTATGLTVSEGFQQAFKDQGTAITEIDFAGDIHVYPVPVKDILQFEITSSEDVEMYTELFDVSGKMVKQIPNYQVASNYQGQLDCGDLSSGVWFLKFSVPNKGTVKVFTITKVE